MGELAQKINRDKSTTTVLSRKLIKENIQNDQVAEMGGDFFMQEELTQEINKIKEVSSQKER